MIKLIPILAAFVGASAFAAPLTLSHFETGVVAEHETALPLEPLALDARGDFITRDTMRISRTDRLDEALKYVNAQTYLNEYLRSSLVAFASMYEYLIQSAHDEDLLAEAVDDVVNADLCLYFAYDDSIRFVQDRVVRLLTADEDASNRLLNAASYVIDAQEDLEDDVEAVKLLIVQCSEFVKSFDS